MTHEDDLIFHDQPLAFPVTEARASLADLVDRVSQNGQRVILTKHKRPAAVLVSMPDLATLQAADAGAHAALSWPTPNVGDFSAADFVLAEDDPADVTARNDLLDLKRKVEGVMAEIDEMIHAHDLADTGGCRVDATERPQVA
ncbi:prevent-host-death family protein [Salipiger thiooxidans]|uniref:Antitoxin n=1 Tax=Salipiger thiooxidans TaxID=282683 RepID=A0A1G7MUJ1_9RHOB|nr:type II toxin-antitoxin system Phd/YefM family antitoxin [Salipiger thiooxidans]MBN8189916.1 type II toxin-antitoxin system Phd/YefM family antitoxin [Salipiger thiooxidans]SDF65433.1 prevent-host-death family protein [Salipiger thiooxidans]